MTSQRVIRNYLLISGLYTLAAAMIWGVNTLFMLDAGLDIGAVFIANAAYTAGMVLFEIPTGVLADVRGRRASFLLSVIVLMLATLAYVGVSMVGGGLLPFVIVSVFLGLGYTFYSGAVEAWLVDALNATGYTGELDHVFARGAMITGAAMIAGSIGGGVLGTFNLQIPYLVRAGLLLVVLVVAYFTMHDIGYTPRPLKLNRLPAEMQIVARNSVQYGWQEPHIRLIVLAGLFQFGFMSWAFYAWQPYLLDLYGNPDAVWITGVIAALLSVSTIIGNSVVEVFTRFCGRRTTLLLGAMGVFSLALVGVGMFQSFWIATPLLLIGMGATGAITPVRQSFIHQLTPSNQRATVVSMDSMVSSSGGIVNQAALGQIANGPGIALGYVIGGALTLLALPLVVGLRRRNNPADFIRGSAGIPGACAAQGLPDIASVDSRSRQPVHKTTS